MYLSFMLEHKMFKSSHWTTLSDFILVKISEVKEILSWSKLHVNMTFKDVQITL